MKRIEEWENELEWLTNKNYVFKRITIYKNH